jgi:hypothetical protein
VERGESGECVCLGLPSLGASGFGAAIVPVCVNRQE